MLDRTLAGSHTMHGSGLAAHSRPETLELASLFFIDCCDCRIVLPRARSSTVNCLTALTHRSRSSAEFALNMNDLWWPCSKPPACFLSVAIRTDLIDAWPAAGGART